MKPTDNHICQLLRNCIRAFNNAGTGSEAVIDEIKKTIKMYADEENDQANKLVQSVKENQGWEDQRDAMYKASQKKKQHETNS